MALYEYQCRSCGNVSEVIQRMSDPPLSTCEECGGELKKLLSAPAIQFKGSGWYVTDYADKGKGDKDSKSSDSAGSKSKESSSDSSGSESSGESGEAKSSSSSGSSGEAKSSSGKTKTEGASKS